MSKQRMLSSSNIIKEYLRTAPQNKDYRENDLRAFVNEAADRINSDEQMIPKIALIPVNNYKANLPDDFNTVIQAAYIIDGKEKMTRARVAQWTQGLLGTDCKLVTNVECPDCSEYECDCSTPVIEFTPDEIWKTSNPGFFTAYQKHFVRAGGNTGIGGGPLHKALLPKFGLMNYSTSSFFNVAYHVNNCTNFNVDTKIEYIIERPNLVTNFKEGKVLLSYFGRPTDKQGYLMIPDNTASINAVKFYMMQQVALSQYTGSGENKYRVMWMDMMQLTEKWIARAISENQMPSDEEFDAFWSKFIHQQLPKWNARQDMYRGTGSQKFKYPNQTYGHRGYDKRSEFGQSSDQSLNL